MIPWQKILNEPLKSLDSAENGIAIRGLADLKKFLDIMHIRHCLVKPYQECDDYPLVESRELLPAFESDACEYKHLPGFSLVAFGRKLDYFAEIFQYDKLHTIVARNSACPLENHIIDENLRIFASRLPKNLQDKARSEFANRDITLLDHYFELMPYLLEMDRAQVLALDTDNLFHLAGVFASFPSDIDSELKRFGVRIGKFSCGDNSLYERNRMFVYQFLMELYGFPIVSERRTSSALFARKLQRLGECFLLRVLGQTDRTLTTYFSDGQNRPFPHLEKIALVSIDSDQRSALDLVEKKGFFLDERKRVVIMRIRYRQHRYDPGNLRQDRALSIAAQEILHPLSGATLSGINIIKDAHNILLRLNDIVAGEYMGRIVYKRVEIVENTDTDEKRLKFLYTWLNKHKGRLIDYSDEVFEKMRASLANYLYDRDKTEIFESLRELCNETRAALAYIQQARKARVLNDISRRVYRGERITYRRMFKETAVVLNDLQYEIVNFFPELVDAIIKCVENMLRDRYVQRKYILPQASSLTIAGQEIRKNYGRVVAILDAIKDVRKTRLGIENHKDSEAGAA